MEELLALCVSRDPALRPTAEAAATRTSPAACADNPHPCPRGTPQPGLANAWTAGDQEGDKGNKGDSSSDEGYLHLGKHDATHPAAEPSLMS